MHTEIVDTVESIYEDAKAEYNENCSVLGQDAVAVY